MKEKIACKLKWLCLGLERKMIAKGKYNQKINDILFYLTNKFFEIERGGKSER